METVLYHLRCFWLQVEEYLTKNGLNDTCLSSHITGSSETGSFRAIDSTKQKCSQESASYLSPGQSLAFWFCLWATVTARWPSVLQASHPHTTGIKGKENYSFYQRGKRFPKPTTKHTSPWSHWPELDFILPCCLHNSQPIFGKGEWNHRDGEDQSWLRGDHTPWAHCGKTPDQNKGSITKEEGRK